MVMTNLLEGRLTDMVPRREIKELNVGGRIYKNLVQHGGLICLKTW